MAMSLQTRVRVLESGSGGANCPECGWDGITPLEPVIDHSYGGVPKENEYCGTCGRPVHITLTWGPEVSASTLERRVEALEGISEGELIERRTEARCPRCGRGIGHGRIPAITVGGRS